MKSGWYVRAATAVFGFSVAIAIAPALRMRPRPGELLSALTKAGYSPRGVVLQFVTAIALTALFAIVGARVARLLAGYRWAEISYCCAMGAAPLTLMHYGNWRHMALFAILAAVIVGRRRYDPQFTRGDAILLPVFFSCCIAFADMHFGGTPVAQVSRAAVAVFVIRLLVRSSDAFLATPVALLAQTGWFERVPGGVIATIILLGVPLVLDRVRLPASTLSLRRYVIYPLIAFLYPIAVVQTPPPFMINFFEDGHSIPVATEMLRGERPYRDIIPTHGLITDGVLDWAALATRHGSLRAMLSWRLVAGSLSAAAMYCLILAATGAAEVSLLGAFLTMLMASGYVIWVRPAAAVVALAATVAATRLRSRRWFMIAGALVVVAWLFSVDFALYSTIVALFAAFRARALAPLLAGIAAAAVPLLAIFAVFGFALDFLRVTFVELPATHAVYFMQPITLPDCLRSPAILHHLGSDECIQAFIWILALIGSCAVFSTAPFRGTRSDAPWLIAIWIVVATASWVERGNTYFFIAGAPFIVAMLYVLRRHARVAAMVLTTIVVLLAQPLRHVITVIPELRRIDARTQPLFTPTVDKSLRALRRSLVTLGPNDTWVDFSNSALTYSLLGRDCPLRQIEVASYQTDAAQREVIGRIERNRHIRAALLHFEGSNADVDGISNIYRAPLVFNYLKTHFEPAFDEDGVLLWRRIR
jgi:hypothetical protein